MINTNNSLSQDQQDDEVANSSEAYEENDVLFFDNNIEQLPSLSNSQKKNEEITLKENKMKNNIQESKQQSQQIQPQTQIQQQQQQQQSKVNLESPSKKSKSKTKSKTKQSNNNNNSNNINININVNEDIELPEQIMEQGVDQLNENSPSTNSPQVESAIELSDDALVVMLSQPPKSIPQMRTKSSFQDFFRGMTEERMKRLLHRAYGNLNDLEREVKVRKRMELLSDVLSQM